MMHIPTYLDVLEKARAWRSDPSKDALRNAENILREGLQKHRYSLPLIDELALVLEKQNREKDALDLLQKSRKEFKDAGEETLCRFGKIYKKLAEGHMETENYAAAYSKFEQSEQQYALAFAKSTGFYPRINELTDRFVRAGLAKALGKPDIAEKLLQSVRDDAQSMLANPAVWKARKPDDYIWIPATQGEANVLLGKWSTAEDAYLEAMKQAAGQSFYHRCMGGQVKLLFPTFGRLGIPSEGKLSEPDAFFALTTDVPK